MADRTDNGAGGGVSYGMGLGSLVAVLCSWMLGNSIPWICLHGVFGWAYLLYLCMGFGGGFPINPN